MSMAGEFNYLDAWRQSQRAKNAGRSIFRIPDNISLVCRSSKQQQIAIRILDDEIPGAPRLLFQLLVKGNTCGLKFEKQQLDLIRCSDSHGYRQQFLLVADRRVDYVSLDAP